MGGIGQGKRVDVLVAVFLCRNADLTKRWLWGMKARTLRGGWDPTGSMACKCVCITYISIVLLYICVFNNYKRFYLA